MLRRSLLIAIAFYLCIAPAGAQARRKLVVISVDGLDARYLRDRDTMGLKIPNIRRLLKEGAAADGVIGVVPTVTWPSHTTLITGVPPSEHGILGNRRPRSEGGDYYWTYDLMKTRSLWQAAKDAGLKTAAITWPVSVGAPVDYNLPEYFLARRGGAMDLEGIRSKATPGLVDEIAKEFPSFPQQWMDDRTRTLATTYILRKYQPDLLTLHLVDLDAEEHEVGPFTQASKAILEYTDQLIGDIMQAMPKDAVLALVSDHGFARVDKVINLPMLMKQQGATGKLMPMYGIAVAQDAEASKWLEKAAKDPANGIGRQIPKAELEKLSPKLASAAAVYEPADGFLFGPENSKELITKPHEVGVHGLWPLRRDYRSVYVLWGTGVNPERLGEIEMTSIAGRLAKVLGVEFTPGR